MLTKAVLLFCAQALLVKCISSQYIGAAYNPAANALAWEASSAAPCACAAAWNAGPYAAGLAAPWAGPMAASPWATGYSPASLAASNGGGLAITSASQIAPTGVSMTSDNVYEGPLAVSGSIPFLGAVALEGALPTAGAGAVTYGCGNGNVAMLSEDIAPAGYNTLAGAYGYGPGVAAELGYGYGSPLSYEAGIAGPGYGPYGYRSCGCGAFTK
ncbi:unnamed protein product, partial [Brenthis ino]